MMGMIQPRLSVGDAMTDITVLTIGTAGQQDPAFGWYFSRLLVACDERAGERWVPRKRSSLRPACTSLGPL